ncbi:MULTISPECIES: hypothetical protein [Methylobacterium]|nr:hypothetical protein [Methylobacterium sp.]
MRALLVGAVAIVAWGIGVCTGVVLMAAGEAPRPPAGPAPEPPRWERST